MSKRTKRDAPRESELLFVGSCLCVCVCVNESKRVQKTAGTLSYLCMCVYVCAAVGFICVLSNHKQR